MRCRYGEVGSSSARAASVLILKECRYGAAARVTIGPATSSRRRRRVLYEKPLYRGGGELPKGDRDRSFDGSARIALEALSGSWARRTRACNRLDHGGTVEGRGQAMLRLRQSLVANVNTEKAMVRDRVISWTAMASTAMGGAVIFSYLLDDVFARTLGLSVSVRVLLSATALVAGCAVLILLPTEVCAIA
jgi:hypothetical protein